MLGVWNAHRSLVQGWHQGLSYAATTSFVGLKPPNYGRYVDTVAQRLVQQPMQAGHKKALLTFLGAKETSKVANVNLGGKVDALIPLVLDSVYHALR